MLRHLAVIIHSRIGALDQVIPHVPLPDDPRSIRPLRFEFNQHVGPYPVFGYETVLSASALRRVRRSGFPHDREDVSIRQDLDVVMRKSVFVELEIPYEVPFEIELLKPASLPASAEHGGSRITAA